MIVTTEFAVGHSSLINGSEGSAHAGHGATRVDCVGLGASVAVGDSSLAARPRSGERGAGAPFLGRRQSRMRPHGRARLRNKTDPRHRAVLGVRQAVRLMAEHAVAHDGCGRVGAAGGSV